MIEREEVMRSVLWAAALVVGFAAVASAQPATQIVNSVGQVDRVGKTFSVWKGNNTTFKVTDRTTFQVGQTPTSMAALKAGQNVAVTYHVDGGKSIADAVVINQ